MLAKSFTLVCNIGYSTLAFVFSLLEYWKQYVAPPEKVTHVSSLKKVASRMLAVLRGIEVYYSELLSKRIRQVVFQGKNISFRVFIARE